MLSDLEHLNPGELAAAAVLAAVILLAVGALALDWIERQ